MTRVVASTSAGECSQLCSQLENVLSKIRPRVDMLWIITCSDRMPSFFSRIDRYVRYKPLRPPEEALRRLKWYIGTRVRVRFIRSRGGP